MVMDGCNKGPFPASQGVDESVITEYIIRMLGLEVCADTKVGNQMIRGISGGQKKRVTSGEMLVSAKRVRVLLRYRCRVKVDSREQSDLMIASMRTLHGEAFLVELYGMQCRRASKHQG